MTVWNDGSLCPHSPWALAGHRCLIATPHYAFLFSRQMSPILAAASAFLFFLLKSAFQQQALPFRPPERRAANQTGDGVWGVREAHQVGNTKNLMPGLMDTGTLEISGSFLCSHFNF